MMQPAFAYPSPRTEIGKTRKDMSAYSLFLIGYDTMEIAARLGLSEAHVLKRITLARDKANGTQTFFERLEP